MGLERLNVLISSGHNLCYDKFNNQKGENMPDSFTETTKISYGKNIKNSFIGALLGIILFLASFVILWLNEGNNVNQIYKANYMEKNAVEISADKISRDNDNKLVQLSGKAITDATLTDGIVSIKDVFALKRNVEMYQWKENVKTESKDELGGSTTQTKTYSYEKVWSGYEINSEEFKKSGYVNPKFPVKSEDFYADKGTLGKFNLTSKQINAMSEYSKYTNLPYRYEYKIFEGSYYKGKDPLNPSIGDIRITYNYVPSGVNISIIAQQKSDDTLTNMTIKKGSVYLQQSGLKTKDEMINSFRKGNQIFTNIIRIAGWLCMFIGMTLLISPLVVIFKVIPFLQKIVGFLTSGVLFLISLALSLLTIAIAWLAYRPLLSIGLIIVICGIIFIIKTKFKPAQEYPQQEE